MKNYILLFCVVFLILLAGCDGQNKSTNSSAELGSVTDHASAADGEAQIAETRAQASVPPAPVELKVAPEDRNQAFNLQLVETEEAYYYVQQKTNEEGILNLIYFCPRGGTAFYPLCSKPNCRHNDFNCNAYCGNELGYYDGSLYTMDFSGFEGIKIIKINIDGTDHRVVAEIDPSNGTGVMSFSCAFHHGKLFMLCDPIDSMPLEQQSYRLIVVSLADGSQTELAPDYFNTAKCVPERFWYYKDKLYGEAYDSKEAPALIEIDALTGKTQSMSLDANSFYATDSTLYYLAGNTGNVTEAPIQGKPGFCEYDLTNGTVRDFGLPVDDIINAKYDDDYIYATSSYRNNWSDSTLYLLSRSYEPVDQIELTDGLGIAAVTSDRIYLYDFIHNSPINYYIDKAQIGSHNLKLISIETVG